MKSTAILCFLPLLAACSGNSVRDTLGLNHQGPDEFRVVSRPPLSVPPQFNLRPPGSSAGSAAPAPARAQAQALVFGAPVATAEIPATANSAETQFLKKAGAENADPQVRTSLIQEKEQVAEQQEESHWYDFFSDPSKKEPVVNAKQEASRIQTDKSTGQPVTTGDTPVVQAKDTGLLGRIFNY